MLSYSQELTLPSDSGLKGEPKDTMLHCTAQQAAPSPVIPFA